MAIDVKFDIRGASAPLGPSDQTALKMYVEKIAALTHDLNMSADKGNRVKWFKQTHADRLVAMLDNMDRYLNQRCTRITFVAWLDHMGSFGAVKNTVKTGGFAKDETASKEMYGDILTAESSSDYQKAGGYLRVPSGMRVYLGASYVAPKTVNSTDHAGLRSLVAQQVNTVFHELSHKVLRTVDYKLPAGTMCYGYDKCVALALSDPRHAIQNADNWGYFMADAYKAEGHGA